MERPKDELTWSKETLIYVDYLELEINRLKEDKRELLIEYDQWMSNPKDKIHRYVSEAFVDYFLSQNKH